MLAVGFGNKIALINFKEKTVEKYLEGHKDLVYSIDFSSDLKYIASGSYDKSFIIWDLNTY